MKITGLYVYPIKGLRGIQLQSARIGPQGVSHDRRFMLYEVQPSNGELRKMQVDSHPRCALFEQQLVTTSRDGGSIVAVRFHDPVPKGSEGRPEDTLLEVPLEPDISSLERIDVVLHGSPASAYRMGGSFDAWLSQRFGYDVILVYLGDGRRPILGKTLLPKTARGRQQARQQRGWVASLASFIAGGERPDDESEPWLTFTDVAPLLVTSEASLRDVRERMLDGLPVEMYKFRPNIVVDGAGESAWAEDFWAELAISPGQAESEPLEDPGASHSLLLTGNCARCTSLNVDYETGKPAEGELGNVLKRLMKERRVDPGTKWSPIFGRYASFDGGPHESFTVCVGDSVAVTRRNPERSVADWPGL